MQINAVATKTLAQFGEVNAINTWWENPQHLWLISTEVHKADGSNTSKLAKSSQSIRVNSNQELNPSLSKNAWNLANRLDGALTWFKVKKDSKLKKTNISRFFSTATFVLQKRKVSPKMKPDWIKWLFSLYTYSPCWECEEREEDDGKSGVWKLCTYCT